jgi:hydrogenase nickel incorporation protein HypA/HybF
MHELSIVEALLDAVREALRPYPDAQVQTVRVRVGALRQVVPDILTFCFTAGTRDSDLASASLELEEVPARARCRQCQHNFPVDDNWFECPRCHATDGALVTGNELELTSLELEDPHCGRAR